MAIIKKQDIKNMSEKERNEKITELQMELIKEKVALGKGGKNKIREIKKTIARLLTFNTLNRLNKPVGNK
ncbi:MAG: Ribosomal protein [archaeon]|jgi:ribosomal protein L29